MDVVIRSGRDALRAQALIAPLHRRASARVFVQIPSLDAAASQRLSHALTRYFSACGCSTSGVAALAAIGWLFVRYSLDADAPVGLFASLLLVSAAALAGKLVALGWSYFRAMRLLQQLSFR